MADHPLAFLLRHLRHLANTGPETERTDRQLLQRFVTHHDDDAFALLVQRHGAMVFGVCRRSLPHSHDAEDAFQATFILLAQKAAVGHWQESVAGWLHETAQRVARNARRVAARRHDREHQAAALRTETASSPQAEAFVRLWLDEELHRLPEKHRTPLVLCHLQGHSHEEAARLLGWPVGTVKGRIARALTQLRRRLHNHGEPLSASSLALVLAERLPAAPLPETLMRTTIDVAVLVARGAPVAQTASASVAALLASTFAARMKTATALLMLLGVLATGATVAAHRLALESPQPTQQASASLPPMEPMVSRKDLHGSPLPPGAIARLGRTRFRHGGTVGQIVYSPDGKLLASSASDELIRLWDASAGNEIRRMRDHNGYLNALVFSPNGRLLAACGQTAAPPHSSGVRIYDVGTGKIVSEFSHQRTKHGWQNVSSMAFSPDGKLLATAGSNGTLYLWDLKTGNELHDLRCSKGVDSVLFSRDGATLFSASHGGSDDLIRRWDVATAKELPPLAGHKNGTSNLALDESGRSLASSGADGFCRIWDLPSGKERLQIRGTYHARYAPIFSPDGKTLAGSIEKQIYFRDAATGKELRRITHDNYIGSVAFSPDGATLAWSSGGIIYLSDPETAKPRFQPEGHTATVAQVAFSQDGTKVLTSSDDESTRAWETRTGRQLYRRKGFARALSPDGKIAASTAENDKGVRVRLWDVSTGKDLYLLPGDLPKTAIGYHRTCAFSSDGKLLVCYGGADASIQVWETATGKEVNRIQVPGGLIFLALSANGQYIVAMNQWRLNAGKWEHNKTPRAWETRSGKEINCPAWLGYPLGFLPESTILAAGRSPVRLWDVHRREECGQLDIPESRVGHPFVFSPNGKCLVTSAGRDGSVYLWETASGRLRKRFDGQTGLVRTAAFSADGKLLVTGGDDGTPLVWDVMDVAAVRQRQQTKLTGEMLNACWLALSSEDAERAWRAMRGLVAAPQQAVTLLGEHLTVQNIDAAKVERWITELDDEFFGVRERAERELAALGRAGVPALRRAQAHPPSAEVARRLKDLLAKLDKPGLSPAELAELRAIEVLEFVGTAEARQLLAKLAQGAADARLTREARASLRRLAKRGNEP